MLCEKCGSMNIVNSENCAQCGASLPAKSACGGFGDILDYEAVNKARTEVAPSSGGTDPVELRKIKKKVELLTAKNKKLTVLSIGSVAFALVALIIAVVVGCFGDDSVKIVEKENASTKQSDNVRSHEGEVEETVDFNVQTNQGREILINKP